MTCPACSKSLTNFEVSGIELDHCPECGGIWFDRFELQKISKTEFAETPELNLNERPNPAKTRKCPKDLYPMIKHFFSKNVRIQIDTCPRCAGIWLDAGEFNLIKQDVLQKSEGLKDEMKDLKEKLFLMDKNFRKPGAIYPFTFRWIFHRTFPTVRRLLDKFFGY